MAAPIISVAPNHHLPPPPVNSDRSFANHPTLKLINQCSNPKQLKQIHAQMLRTGLFYDPFSASNLVFACFMCRSLSLDYARKVFDQIPEPNIHSWNTAIRAYSSSRDPSQSLLLFIEMLYRCQELPNKFTYPFLIKAAAELSASRVGKCLHGMVVKSLHSSDVFILNSLVSFYASSGFLELAYRVFLDIPEKDVVSWNSLIKGFVQGGFPDKDLDLFNEMLGQDLKPTNITMVSVFWGRRNLGWKVGDGEGGDEEG